MATGGKAYGFRSSYDRLSALIAQARGSDTGEVGATCCISTGRPLEGVTTLSGWSGLAWIACLLPHSAGLECVRF